MSNANRYPKQVFWSDDDEGYIAVATDLPGSSAFGETEQEALAELEKVIPAWIAAARKAGNPIPPPSKPGDEVYSGKFMLRIPKTLHRQLAVNARSEEVSLNQHIMSILSMVVGLTAMEAAIRARTDVVIASATEPVPIRMLSRWVSGQKTYSCKKLAYVDEKNWSHLPHDRQMAMFKINQLLMAPLNEGHDHG